MRVGLGFDAHRLVAGRPLILGGVKIPYHLGLMGHSDADVLTHAIGDALLGAVGAGDLGAHFPDSDPAYKDISSLMLAGKHCQAGGAPGISAGERGRHRGGGGAPPGPPYSGDEGQTGADPGPDPGRGELEGHHHGADGLYRAGGKALPPMRWCW